MMNPAKIAIGVSSGELARYANFYDSLLHIRGITSESVIHAKSGSVAENRNGIQAIAAAKGFEAILYVDDDQVFSPSTLEKLAQDDVDVVSGLYLKREPPFIPHAYHKLPNGQWDIHCLTPNDKGLLKVDMCGAGCLLVKMHVFEKLTKPYWTLGQGTRKDLWADDEKFCEQVRAAGFDIHVDLGCPVGHCLNGHIWPSRNPANGEWGSSLFIGKEVAVTFAAAAKPSSQAPTLWD